MESIHPRTKLSPKVPLKNASCWELRMSIGDNEEKGKKILLFQ